MDRKVQDKIWSELSDESKETLMKEYSSVVEAIGNCEESYRLASVFGHHNLSSPKCYYDVACRLFKDGFAYTLDKGGYLAAKTDLDGDYTNGLNCISEGQCKKLVCLNKLSNVAYLLNEGWKPDWENQHTEKWFFSLCRGEVSIISSRTLQYGLPCFKDEETAELALEILGKETVIRAIELY